MVGRKIAVTGGAGFLGRHLCRALTEAGAEVICVDNFSHGFEGRLYDIPVRYGSVQDEFLDTCEVDTVLNLAASVGGIYHNISHQLEMFIDNMEAQAWAAWRAREAGVKTFMQVSSVCIYDPDFQGYHRYRSGIPETQDGGEPQAANSGYAWAKRVGERVPGWAGFKEWFVVRPSNMIGPGDYFDDKAHVVPALIRRARENQELIVYGDPEYIREFVDVRDVARALITILTDGKTGETYNIGSGETISMHDLAHMIRDIVSPEKDIVFLPADGGDPYRRSNSDKLRNLGWQPRYSIRESVQDCASDYAERHHARYDEQR
jgi:nucleoside-diphosphate-sugar epimerase